ncbi:MAG: SNF2-related protein, partial [Verrucomicrobiaceae bacterium]
MLITEKTLGDLGGWQAMKSARERVMLGTVENSTREGDVFRGVVREGKRKFAVSLIVQGPTKAECRCSCVDAQARGLVCAHAIAVALATISSSRREEAQISRPNANEITRGHQTPKKSEPPHVGCYDVPHGLFDVFIPAQRIEAMSESSEQPQGRRIMAGRLPVFLQFQPGGTEIDPLTSWLAAQGVEAATGPLSLEPASLDGFFTSLRQHPRVWDGRPGAAAEHRKRITVGQDDGAPITLAVRLPSAPTVEFALARSVGFLPPSDTQNGDSKSPLPDLSALSMPSGKLWLYDRARLCLTTLSDAAPEVGKLIHECLAKTGGGVVRDLRWLATWLDAIEQVVNLETDEALSHLRLMPAEPKFIIELDGSPRQATARVQAQVGPVLHPVRPQQPERENHHYPIQAEDGGLVFYQRNTARESRLRAELEATGFTARAGEDWELRGEREVAEFFASALPRLERKYQVVTSERWRSAFSGWRRVAPLVKSRSDGGPPASTAAAFGGTSRGWLDMEFSYQSADGFSIPRNEVLRLLRSKQSTVRGKQGQVYVLDSESCDDFESLLSESGARLGDGSGLALSADNQHILNDYYANNQLPPQLVLPDLEEVKRHLGDLADRLRDYQIDGVRWLIAAVQAGRGAMLADDMGLGKTLQVLALLRWLKSVNKSVNNSVNKNVNNQGEAGPILIICPTSLLGNWEAELQKFTPELIYIIHHGTDRQKIENNITKYNVILTTYSLLVNEISKISQINFAGLVLDEASYIRNPDTAVAKAVCQLRVPVRVALSGTPVENSVRDLWSIMRFVQPGFLGDRKDFEDRYLKPLASSATTPEDNGRLLRRLRTRLGPFVLRRTKKEVVRELPDKVEKVIFCELSDPQKEVYRRILEEGQEEIRQARRRTGAGSARMTMFT